MWNSEWAVSFFRIEYSIKLDVLVPNRTVKIVCGLHINSYEQIMFEIFRTNLEMVNSLKNNGHSITILNANREKGSLYSNRT